MAITTLKFKITESLEDIPQDGWDLLARDETPFMEYGWLRSLETTGCLDAEAGWMPQILTAWREKEEGDELVGAIPMYVKGNSFGEFVYDWAWADLARRVGVSYYPKLIAAIPFSPVSGSRLLTHPELDASDRDAVLRMMIRVALGLANEIGVSGLHFLFVPPEQAEILAEEGMMIRNHYQYHWRNQEYATFDDFLGRFKAKKRNKIRREIREVKEAGVTFDTLSGTEMTPELMEHVFSFYTSTCHKFHWGRVYLNRPFFERIHAEMPERLLVMLARNSSGEPIGGAFNLAKEDRLYGRYWGCSEEVQFLHFVTCCYEPIKVAIERGIQHFEPGQGGHHKYKRGFNPIKTYSAHWIADDRMSMLLKHHLMQERQAVEDEIQHLLDTSPLRCD